MKALSVYVGNRYKSFPNIVCVIGVDADPSTIVVLQNLSPSQTDWRQSSFANRRGCSHQCRLSLSNKGKALYRSSLASQTPIMFRVTFE